MDDVAVALDDDGEGDASRERLDVAALARRINGAVLTLYADHLSDDGRQVDYASMRASTAFGQYVAEVARLADEVTVDQLCDLTDDQVKATFINLYNAIVIHATVVRGAPGDMAQRTSFFAQSAYRIGGELLSLDDIEHGVLRGNAVHPAPWFRGSQLDVARRPQLAALAARMRPVDPRIHFALVCGAVSCPPIRVFTSRNLEFGLDAAAANFCSQSVRAVGERALELSSIFKWYACDFAPSVVSWLAERSDQLFRSSESPEADVLAVLAAAQRGEQVSLSYAAYDWSLNGH
ncbi:glutaredoxin [Thecamonas trahens ATCC 50062]|uniref:Glutaredoxin n=1 Tax=Thecamonas trahens ATCC 50062 TaxID=461836 RepID=A0A0L0D8B4_THETB|nr:glutaredoxin [Thecamonas trahens ATCC 50062]KNC48485.1 glutaredoxin [Thecamonas trahens ATCC 50062]|eukprot:XP_013758597.1 glutaredoxin [Thecamonas trahens ATCC 50062]